MDTVDRALTWIFFISLVLVLVAYYVGTKSTVSAFSTAFDNLLLTVTGRITSGKNQGAFAGYPK